MLPSFLSVFRTGVNFGQCIMRDLGLASPASARRQNVGLTGFLSDYVMKKRIRNRKKGHRFLYMPEIFLLPVKFSKSGGTLDNNPFSYALISIKNSVHKENFKLRVILQLLVIGGVNFNIPRD
jgi:hypothetical protein